MSSPTDIIPLTRFRALRQNAKQRADSLISSKDAGGAVRALSVQELFSLITDLGFADSQDLIELSSPEQVRGCLDLSCWDRDRISWEATLPWLSALLECGFEKVGEVWPTLDSEFAALIIRRGAQVFDSSLGEAPDDSEERPYFATPDQTFTLVLTGEREEEQLLTRRLVEDLYRADIQEARHVLLSARSELSSGLEEMSYRWRAGRLADLGYVEYYEALEVFRPLDPNQISIDEGTQDPSPRAAEGDEARMPGNLPQPILQQVIGRSFLAEVLGTISNAAVSDRLEASLLYLVNRVLSAARVSPGDSDALRVGASHAACTLALGLEHLSEGNPERARAFLENVALSRIHRVGYTLTLRLARSAKVLARPARNAKEPAPTMLSALLGARPFFACTLEDPGSQDVRPFESRLDLARVATELQELTLRVAIADGLGASTDDAPPTLPTDQPPTGLDDAGRTALLRHYQEGGALSAAPLSTAQLQAAAQGARPSDEERTAALRVFRALLSSKGVADTDRLASVLERWDTDIQMLLEQIKTSGVDPRYAEGLLFS